MNRKLIIASLLVAPLLGCATAPDQPAADTYLAAETAGQTTDVKNGYDTEVLDNESVLLYQSPGVRRMNSGSSGSY
ncbi:MAG: hypothetical protein OET44_13100 [Gammaproteobacteria bacterium]|nr:hypothetical protein [Gammaproteobacteria bacterium]